MATAAELRYRRRAVNLVRGLQRLEPATMRAIQVQARALRKEILEALADTDSWTAARLPSILQELDLALKRWADGTAGAIRPSLRSASAGGSSLADAFFSVAGQPALVATPGTLPLIVSSQVEALNSGIASLVRQVAEQTKTKIAREIQSAMLGLQRPGEAMASISKLVPGIRQPVRDASGRVVRTRYVGPSARAQTIVQTELPRAFNAATNARLRQHAAEIPELQKEWLSVLGPTTRDSHAAAHGQRRPVDQPFSVGGAALMFPGDPSGPPREVINCQCVDVPVLRRWDAKTDPLPAL